MMRGMEIQPSRTPPRECPAQAGLYDAEQPQGVRDGAAAVAGATRSGRSIGGEAVDQPVAHRGAERALTAPARRMRRVPGRAPLPAAAPVVMADHRATVVVTRPAVAGRVEAIDRQRSIGVAAREDVVAAAVDAIPLLRQRRLEVNRVVLAVEVGEV